MDFQNAEKARSPHGCFVTRMLQNKELLSQFMNTVHSESIYTPSLFPHLLCYSLILEWIQFSFFLINLHTISHNDKVKTGLDIFAHLLKIKNGTFTIIAMPLKIELRSTLFPLIILEMFLQLD